MEGKLVKKENNEGKSFPVFLPSLFSFCPVFLPSLFSGKEGKQGRNKTGKEGKRGRKETEKESPLMFSFLPCFLPSLFFFLPCFFLPCFQGRKENKKGRKTGKERKQGRKVLSIQNFKECTGASKRQTGDGRHNRIKFLVPIVTSPTSAKLEGSLESDYRNTGLKWNPKQDAHSLEAFVHQV